MGCCNENRCFVGIRDGGNTLSGYCTPISSDCCSCGVIGTSCLPRCEDISCYTCYSRTFSPQYKTRNGTCCD